jgi:hypothetical protein
MGTIVLVLTYEGQFPRAKAAEAEHLLIGLQGLSGPAAEYRPTGLKVLSAADGDLLLCGLIQQRQALTEYGSAEAEAHRCEPTEALARIGRLERLLNPKKRGTGSRKRPHCHGPGGN